MAEFSSRPGRFSIIMQLAAGKTPGSFWNLAYQVNHAGMVAVFRRARTLICDRQQVIRKLAGLGTFYRPVPRVVHARCKLIRKKCVANDKELESEYANIVQMVEQFDHVLLRLLCEGGVFNRGTRSMQNAANVLVLRQAVSGSFTIDIANADR